MNIFLLGSFLSLSSHDLITTNVGEGMSRQLDDLRCKQDQFIHALYSVTEGNCCTCGDLHTISRKLGFDHQTCVSIVSYFVTKGIIERHHESLSHLVKLTTKGVDFVEVTFAAAHMLEAKLTEYAEGAASVLDGHNPRTAEELQNGS
jgi:predicted transcriptional regulator